MFWYKMKHHAICGTANYMEHGTSYFEEVCRWRQKKELWYGFDNFS
jgi:hypothetical protein